MTDAEWQERHERFLKSTSFVWLMGSVANNKFMMCFDRGGIQSPLPTEHIPASPAVYVLFDGQEPVYVGSTSNFRSRLYTHKKLLRSMKDPYFKFSTSRQYGDWLMREARLIRRLSPKLNVRGKA